MPQGFKIEIKNEPEDMSPVQEPFNPTQCDVEKSVPKSENVFPLQVTSMDLTKDRPDIPKPEPIIKVKINEYRRIT